MGWSGMRNWQREELSLLAGLILWANFIFLAHVNQGMWGRQGRRAAYRNKIWGDSPFLGAPCET